MAKRTNLMAFRFTDAQKENIERLAQKLQRTKTEVISLALYQLALRTFGKEAA